MMRVSGDVIANAHPTTILKAWPIKVSHDGTLYTLHIGTPTGPLFLDLETHDVENLRHAFTMLLGFPRLTHIDFPTDRPAQEQPQTEPLDIPHL